MHDQSNIKPEYFPFPIVSQSLKSLSEEEFAALGTDDLVFVRSMTGAELTEFIPQAGTAPDDQVFQMLMSADGSPILVTDSDAAIDDWLDERDITLVHRH